MISHLHIENMNIIKNEDIFFSAGLNIITGETGAGKSAIINALNFVCGNRAVRVSQKDRPEGFSVSAVICNLTDEEVGTIQDLGYMCEDKTVLLSREITSDSRNICRVNGRPATVSILREIGKIAVSVYNQHEGHKILSKENHINYIDDFAKLSEKLGVYKELYEKMKSIKKQIEEMSMDEYEKQRKSDLLNYQINELEEGQISVGEIARLKRLKNTYDNKKKILNYLSEAKILLDGTDTFRGSATNLEEASNLLESASEYLESIAPISQKIKSLFYEVSESVSDLNEIIDGFEYSAEDEYENFNQRLDYLYKLSGKYGKTEEDMISFLEDAKSKLSELEQNDFKVKKLHENLEVIIKELEELAKDISATRFEKGKILSNKIQEELHSLDMPNAQIAIEQETTQLGPNGTDKIQFLMSANAGEKLKPMSDIASGGEVSRIALAVSNIISGSSQESIIFDEIDTGVSGSAANKIGFKLKQLSKSRQVICITHLAQIASFADQHFLVSKNVVDGKTISCVTALDMNARKSEIARIIGGIKISESALKAAQEMICTNRTY